MASTNVKCLRDVITSKQFWNLFSALTSSVFDNFNQGKLYNRTKMDVDVMWFSRTAPLVKQPMQQWLHWLRSFQVASSLETAMFFYHPFIFRLSQDRCLFQQAKTIQQQKNENIRYIIEIKEKICRDVIKNVHHRVKYTHSRTPRLFTAVKPMWKWHFMLFVMHTNNL